MLRLALVLPLAGALVLTGCGGVSRQAVSGTVKFKGQPLNQGTIRFTPSDPKAGQPGSALITDGEYEIPEKSGLAPGTYKVSISSPEGDSTPASEAGKGKGKEAKGKAKGKAQGKAPVPAKERIPEDYNVKSKKTVEVKKGEANKFDFEIP